MVDVSTQSFDWIVEHCASNQNIKLLRALFNDVPFPDIPPLSSNSSRLLHSLIIRERIAYTPHHELRTTFLEQNNIFHHYHQLYPPIGNDLSKAHKAELIGYIVPLFQSEIELKVQIILSTNHWRNNYAEHKKLNDQLLLATHYTKDDTISKKTFIPNQNVIRFINKSANGIIFIQRIHQQLNYLGQQCTKPSMNLRNTNDENVNKIKQFLNKHSFDTFKTELIGMIDAHRAKLCMNGKDFLSRLSRADMNKILEIPQKIPAKYALRTVVDVRVGGNWCPGTIIQRFDEGSLNIALHKDELDARGRYQYDVHHKVKDLAHVILCINEDGEIETDANPELLVDTNTNLTSSSMWSSPQKQQQIKHTKQQQREQFTQLLANRNRDKTAQNEGNEEHKSRARKRSREEFESQSEAEKTSTKSNPTKRRKTDGSDGQKTVRRKSARLLAKEKEKEKAEKKIQTKITSTKDKIITFAKQKKKRRINEDEEGSDGEEQRWSDDMTEEMKQLDVVGTKKKMSGSKRPPIWKKEEEDALMECYKKHDRARKLVHKYAIWEQIKHDPAYCEHWKDRSKNSIQKKARSLLGLTSKKKK
eukprot:32884_1